jgi:hypothetical protein
LEQIAMFYRNASTVLTRFDSHRGATSPDAPDEALASLDTALLDARRRTEQPPKNGKLSNFEKELLLAWSQD